MLKPLVAGNWKMNKTVAEARDLVSVMDMPLGEIAGVEKVLCPPYMALMAVAFMLENSNIGVGAQNLHWEEKGAFTGEVSANMIREFCKYVIIGHSERRTYFGETDETVNKKVLAAIKAGLGFAGDLDRLRCAGSSGSAVNERLGDAASHSAAFVGTNLASGIYIYRLTAGSFTATGKMVLMK